MTFIFYGWGLGLFGRIDRATAMLFGFAFFSHQVGGFLGVWLGGLLFENTGSYDIVWWLSVFFGVASALINLPIKEEGGSAHSRRCRQSE